MFRRGETVNRLYTVASDDDGEVEVSSEPGRLWVTHEDYGPCALVISDLRMPRGDTVHAVPLYPPTDVRIRVRRADDAIVEGFRYGIGDDVWREPPLNAEGAGAEVLHPMYLRFYLDPHARLTDEFVVTAVDGDPRGSTRWKLQPGVENAVEIVLDAQPTSILGVVSDADGQPVEGAQVAAISGEKGFVYVIQDQLRGADVPRVKTSSGGRYELLFADTPAPIWLVVTHPEQPFFMSERLKLLPKQARQHDIRLSRGATLVARYRPEHLAEGDLQVTLSNENGAEYPVIDYRRSEPPDDHGAVRFERVGAGAWTVQWMDGKVFRRQAVYLEDGESYEILLGSQSREGAVRASGTLLADGHPVPDIGLWLWDGTTDQVIATQQTDSAGAFDLGWIAPGTHRLGVGLHSRSKSSDVPLHYRNIDIRPETVPLAVDVSTRVLVGRVVDAQGPVAAVTIRAFSKQPIEQKEILTTFNRAQSGADGEYRLGGVYDFPCVLVYEKSGYLPKRIPWTPTGPKEAGIEDVLLEKAGDEARIRIRIVESKTDTPITRALAQLGALGYDAPLGAGDFRPTSSAGEFVSEPQPVGRYRVYVRPGRRLGLQQYTGELVEFDHTPGGEPVTIRCRRGGSVRLDLKATGGLPPTRAFVDVKDENGRTILNWRGTRTLAFTGSAVLVGLPLGELRVTVKAPGWTTLEFPLTVSPGRVARVTRRMEPAE